VCTLKNTLPPGLRGGEVKMERMSYKVIEEEIISVIVSGGNPEAIIELCEEYKKETSTTQCLFYYPMKACILVNNHYAARILVEQGFDVNGWDDVSGSRPIVMAAYKRRMEIVQLLVNANSDINNRDRCGYSAILHATINGDTEMVEYLIDQGATVGDKYDFRWENQFTKKSFLTAFTKNEGIIALLLQAMQNEFLQEVKMVRVKRYLYGEEENPGRYPVISGDVALVCKYIDEHPVPIVWEEIK
jgi:ankyrin repeat protein